MKVFFVTHLYDFASSVYQEERDDTLFLRAERLADGIRTYRVQPGRPLETSFGRDLYRKLLEARRTTA